MKDVEPPVIPEVGALSPPQAPAEQSSSAGQYARPNASFDDAPSEFCGSFLSMRTLVAAIEKDKRRGMRRVRDVSMFGVASRSDPNRG